MKIPPRVLSVWRASFWFRFVVALVVSVVCGLSIFFLLDLVAPVIATAFGKFVLLVCAVASWSYAKETAA